MNNTVTANQLKTKGISIADNLAKKGLETVITVRGEAKYVVIPIKQYHQLKEYELTAALIESEQDVKSGQYKEDTVDDHIRRITDV